MINSENLENTEKHKEKTDSSSKNMNKAGILPWGEKMCHPDVRKMFLLRFTLLLPH